MSIHARKYVYRNLPCTGRKWAVSGRDHLNGSGGILEYCYSPVDAAKIIRLMQKATFGNKRPRFSGLKTILV